jgi:hypothetical protein
VNLAARSPTHTVTAKLDSPGGLSLAPEAVRQAPLRPLPVSISSRANGALGKHRQQEASIGAISLTGEELLVLFAGVTQQHHGAKCLPAAERADQLSFSTPRSSGLA